MQTMSVAPAAPLMPFEPPAPGPNAEGSPTPFGETFRKELAKPESRKAEETRPEKSTQDEAKSAAPKSAEDGAEPKDGEAQAARRHPAVPAEWADLIEGQAAAEDLELDAFTLRVPGEATEPAEADAGSLIITDASGEPLHPLTALSPASARANDAALSLDRRALAVDASAQRGEALAAAAAEAANPRARGAADDAARSDALLSSFAERMAATESPGAGTHTSALDGLGATAFGARMPAHALAASAALQSPASARIDAPLGQSAWSDAFQQKIVWLVDRQQRHAELHLNPAHLGPVDVSLTLGDDGTDIMFVSPHAAVREAIEASLADLKTALGEKGLSLGQATVGADSQAAREQRESEARSGAAGARGGSGSGGEAAAELAAPPRMAARGLVDIYA